MASKGRFSAAATRLLLLVLTSTVLSGAGETAGTQLTASWLDNSAGAATTRLERRLETETAYAAIADIPAGLTTYVDTSTSAGITYCYRAAAFDADGVSAYSNEACGAAPYDSETVTVGKAGTGSGTITSTPSGIDCGTTCPATYSAGTAVTLAAIAATGSNFTGWSGNCAGTASCTLASNGAITVTANFSTVTVSPVTYTLTIAKSGPGTITSTPAGINCGSDCSDPYASGKMVTLTATPSKGAAFSGWSGGGCAGSSPTCTITVNSTMSVSAVFKNGRK